MAEPLECPYCHVKPEPRRDWCTWRWYVRCRYGLCRQNPAGRSADRKEDAIQNWNDDVSQSGTANIEPPSPEKKE